MSFGKRGRYESDDDDEDLRTALGKQRNYGLDSDDDLSIFLKRPRRFEAAPILRNDKRPAPERALRTATKRSRDVKKTCRDILANLKSIMHYVKTNRLYLQQHTSRQEGIQIWRETVRPISLFLEEKFDCDGFLQNLDAIEQVIASAQRICLFFRGIFEHAVDIAEDLESHQASRRFFAKSVVELQEMEESVQLLSEGQMIDMFGAME